MTDKLPELQKRRPKNPTHVPRNDGLRWNASQIGEALSMHRNTVSNKLRSADLEPDGWVSNSPVWHLSRAMPVLFGHPPRSPK